MTSPEVPDVPAWFTAAVAVKAEQRAATVEGTSIAYRVWGDPADRGIVLVHGGGAHARWWDHIAPLLANGWQVIAMDLSGHGDSGRRPSYGLDVWGREVLGVIADAGLASPVVIGHSMGGIVTLRMATVFGSRMAGVVAIDSPVRDISPEEAAARQQRAFGPLRVYPTREEALARFRPIPNQPVLPYIAEYVAAASVQPVEGGWTWKFDPRVFIRDQFTATVLTRLDCRVALFRAEHGIVSEQVGEVMYDRLGRVAPQVVIPVAGHHIMLDQPIALVAALRTLLADWDHSIPHE
jgi:pimeloyl-ACP methyl ester carboxylesterase